jgi:5'-nucleotidase
MLFLLTNDDGIDSPGLEHLARCLSDLGDVYVVAPERERSAAGHSITMHKPIRVRPKEDRGKRIKVWETSGSPADCVVVGVFDLLPQKPNLVVSGINLGPNLGDDLTYSGTVSGALEGFICDIPALAISLATYENPLWEGAAQIAQGIVKAVLSLSSMILLNINIPNYPRNQIKGFALTRLGRRRYASRLTRRTDQFGRPYYWIGGKLEEKELEPGTDCWAIENKLVSLTPLTLDFTDYEKLRALEPWRQELEKTFFLKCS